MNQDPNQNLDYQYLESLLKKYNPILYYKWMTIVLPAIEREKSEKIKLDELLKQRNNLLNQAKTTQKVLKVANLKKPQGLWYELLLTVGLSIMLFLGFLGVFDVQINDFRSIENVIKLVISLVGSICINLAEKTSLVRHVEYDAKLQEILERKKKSWVQMQLGRPPFWIASIMVLFESSFGAVGITQFLFSENTEKFWFKLMLFCAVALAAFVNVTMAWGLALDRVTWESNYYNKAKDNTGIHPEKIIMDAESARVRLNSLANQINYQTREYKKAMKKATDVYNKFTKEFQKLMKTNKFEPDKIYPDDLDSSNN